MGIFYLVGSVFPFLSRDLFPNLILFVPLLFVPFYLIISIIFFILSLDLFIAPTQTFRSSRWKVICWHFDSLLYCTITIFPKPFPKGRWTHGNYAPKLFPSLLMVVGEVSASPRPLSVRPLVPSSSSNRITTPFNHSNPPPQGKKWLCLAQATP